MKSIGKLLRIVVVVTMLSLLGVALPALPALAAESVQLSPEEGRIGQKIDVTGNGFRKSTGTTDYIVYIFLSPEEADEGDDIDSLYTYHKVSSKSTDADGKFETYFYVPGRLTDGYDDEDVHGGTYYVYTAYRLHGTIKSKTMFSLVVADITLDPVKGKVGTEVEITGEDFNGGEHLTLQYDGDEMDVASGDSETESDGGFTSTTIVPESTAGKHTIAVTDATGAKAEAEFTVEQEITITPNKAAPGEKVTVKGTGFGKDADVSIDFDGDEAATDWTDIYGSFDFVFTVPAKSPGTYDMEAEDTDGNRDTVDFTIAAGVSLSQMAGNVASEVTISGSGFTPKATVNINYDTESITSTATDADGGFSVTFTVPKSKAGAHTITASDGTNPPVTTIFTMESVPPPMPEPLLPLDGTRTKSPAHFDWEEVTDPSGVTYTLQIATDENFSHIVVEKMNIADSEYTLTKEDPKLKSTKEAAPYYWRVKAVDGADNASGWTSPGAFSVGLTFELTGWILYVLVGIAGLLLLGIGFLLFRRLVLH
jgi:hypothetical protein